MKVFGNLDKTRANAAKKHWKMAEKGQKTEGKYGKMKVEYTIQIHLYSKLQNKKTLILVVIWIFLYKFGA